MGPVRHRLINLLSIVVVVQLAVAMVALAARGGMDFGRPGDAPPAAEATDLRQPGSVLAAGKFTKRRGSKTASSRAEPPAAGAPAPAAPASGASAPVVAPTTSTTVAAQPSTSAGQSPATGTPTTGTPTTGAPTTATTGRSSPATPASATAGRPATLTDPAGDTTADGAGTPISESRADIVSTGAAYGPNGITFMMQVQRPTDPRTDERWASDTTYATWSVDTNGDSQPDFEVQYFVDDGHNVGGSVSRPGDDETSCQASSATFSAEGYKVTFDPGCLNNPASFSYKAALFYDTNPADENADVATDVAPNGGWSFPIRNSG